MGALRKKMLQMTKRMREGGRVDLRRVGKLELATT